MSVRLLHQPAGSYFLLADLLTVINFTFLFKIAMVGFKYDNFVRLQGLSNAACNGKLARITCLLADETTGRYRVVLQDNFPVASRLSREVFVKPENMMRACDCCHLSGAATMQYCGKCKNAAYCNAQCQRSDWTRHKVNCSEMNSVRQLVKIPLILAATRGNLTEVENLVRAGADVNKGTKESGRTPLIMAALEDHLAVVQYLVQHGADIENTANDGRTPLYFAAQRGLLAVVQYLVQQGADVDKVDSKGTTPLHSAASDGYLAVVRYLVQQGADKNQAANDGYTPLIVAARKGHLAVVQCLVQEGADINKAHSSGATPLAMAAGQGHLATVQCLV